MNRIIESVLGDGRRGSVEFKDGFFGHLQGSHQDDNPSIAIGSVSIDLHLTASGLEFSYSLNRLKSQKLWQLSREPGPWSGSFIIAWEILILRYPRLANYRLKTLG
jgi:hypothetical protein